MMETTHTLMVTTREHAFIQAALAGLEAAYLRAHEDASEVRALGLNLTEQVVAGIVGIVVE